MSGTRWVLPGCVYDRAPSAEGGALARRCVAPAGRSGYSASAESQPPVEPTTACTQATGGPTRAWTDSRARWRRDKYLPCRSAGGIPLSSRMPARAATVAASPPPVHDASAGRSPAAPAPASRRSRQFSFRSRPPAPSGGSSRRRRAAWASGPEPARSRAGVGGEQRAHEDVGSSACAFAGHLIVTPFRLPVWICPAGPLPPRSPVMIWPRAGHSDGRRLYSAVASRQPRFTIPGLDIRMMTSLLRWRFLPGGGCARAPPPRAARERAGWRGRPRPPRHGHFVVRTRPSYLSVVLEENPPHGPPLPVVRPCFLAPSASAAQARTRPPAPTALLSSGTRPWRSSFPTAPGCSHGPPGAPHIGSGVPRAAVAGDAIYPRTRPSRGPLSRVAPRGDGVVERQIASPAQPRERVVAHSRQIAFTCGEDAVPCGWRTEKRRGATSQGAG